MGGTREDLIGERKGGGAEERVRGRRGREMRVRVRGVCWEGVLARGVGLVGGGVRKMSRGVFVKRQSPLVRVEINFSWRSYVEKIRTAFLWDLNMVYRFVISSTSEGFFAK
jgi:hypothetical protein